MWPILLFICITASQANAQRPYPISVLIEGLKAAHDSLSGPIEDIKFQAVRHQLAAVGLPATSSVDDIVYHSAYALVYNEHHEQAQWVAHLILPEVATGTEDRTNDFRADPLIKSGSAVHEDYAHKTKNAEGKTKTVGFGYDRGHLAPSADFRYSKKALSESFYYSNMSPQLPALNRGRWSDLEDAMRSYCVRENTPIFIVSGGVLTDDLSKLEQGINKVSIPRFYYKVALDLAHQRAIGFVMPNAKCEFKLDHYSCSIDSIEKMTGLDFFSTLPDDIETKLESGGDYSPWLP